MKTKSCDGDTVPLVYWLADIYDNRNLEVDNVHVPKYMLLARRFEELYGEKPDFFTRAPGTVTLFGNKLSGYNEASIAIEQDVVIAVRASSEPYAEIHNFVENLYRHLKIPVDLKPLEASDDMWANKFIVPFKHIIDSFKLPQKIGFKLLILPMLPENEAGLSFDSAIGIASALVALTLYGLYEKTCKEKLIMGPTAIVPLYSEKNSAVIHDEEKICEKVKLDER